MESVTSAMVVGAVEQVRSAVDAMRDAYETEFERGDLWSTGFCFIWRGIPHGIERIVFVGDPLPELTPEPQEIHPEVSVTAYGPERLLTFVAEVLVVQGYEDAKVDSELTFTVAALSL